MGSFREIELVRDNKVIEVIDLTILSYSVNLVLISD